jgi:gliding motility-associated-like protein
MLFFSSDVSAQICPFAKADLDSTNNTTPITIWIGKNDSVGPSLPAPSLVITSGPSNGIVTIINGDSIIYTPNSGFVGNDFFFYTVCDTPSGCGCASSQVVVRVRATPCPDALSLDDTTSTLNGFASLIRFLQNDTAGSGFSYSSTSILSGPSNGSFTLAGLDSLIYTPDSGFTGIDSLQYSACNSCGNCDTAFIYVTATAACNRPTALDDSVSNVAGTNTMIDIISNDISDSAISSITILNSPLHGTATLSGVDISYSSDSSYVGDDMLTYIICSSCGCDTATVYINVSERCISPMAMDDIGATGYSPACSQLFNVTLNDMGNYLNNSIVSGPNHGTASISGTGIIYSSDSTLLGGFDTIVYAITNICGTDTASLFIFVNPTFPCNGIHPQIIDDTLRICRNDDSIIINARGNDFDPDGDYVSIRTLTAPPFSGTAYILNDSQIVYKPNTGFFGTDVFYYEGCDDGLPNLCNIARIFIFIDECRNTPVIIDSSGNPIDTIIVNLIEDHDSLLCVPLYDLDGDNVSTSIIGVWENGTFTNITDTCIWIQPNLNQTGSDTVILIACDDRDNLCDTVYLIINVTPVNDPPVGNVDIITTTGGPVTVNPLGNDTDPDMGDSLLVTFILNLNPNSGTAVLNPDGTITFTPDSLFAGIDTIAYIVCDGNGGCDTTAVLVFVAPRANDDYATTAVNTPINITLMSNDIISGNTVASLCSNPSNGTVTIVNGVATYTPNTGYSGNDQFCYVICDTATGLCDTAIAYIVIQNNVLFIPQGFSPNGDGINDFWNIQGIENYPNAEVVVFNRWGDEVWASGVNGYKNNSTDGFIGDNKQNNILPDATYYYVVKFNSNDIKNQAGFLQIHR